MAQVLIMVHISHFVKMVRFMKRVNTLTVKGMERGIGTMKIIRGQSSSTTMMAVKPEVRFNSYGDASSAIT